jgi:hypothetical protein
MQVKPEMQGEFDHNEGPGLMFPLVWGFIVFLTVIAVIIIVRWLS